MAATSLPLKWIIFLTATCEDRKKPVKQLVCGRGSMNAHPPLFFPKALSFCGLWSTLSPVTD